MITVGAAIKDGTSALRNTSLSPRLDSELLLCMVLEIDRLAIVSRPDAILSQEQNKRFLNYIDRRKASEPIAYITGKQEFWGLEFEVTPDVLIPRPETEHIVEQVLEFMEGVDTDRSISILELGTGSGCLAISIATELLKVARPFSIVAVDNCEAALQIARRNAHIHGTTEEINFLRSNWFESVPEEKFSIVISNPPYVDPVSTDVSAEIYFEPAKAIFSEENGLQDIRQILNDVPTYLQPDAKLFLECGSDQAEQIFRIIRELYGDRVEIRFHRDLAGHQRVVECSFSSASLG